MRKYWYPSIPLDDQPIQIAGDLFHHIFGVCRQDLGSQFGLLSPDGRLRKVEAVRVGKKDAQVKVLSNDPAPELRRPHIHLCMSLPKLPVMEAVLEKAVELGVAHIHPFISQFSFFRTADKVSEERIHRWEKIIISATQQSGRGELMKLHSTTSMDKLIEEIHRTPRSLCLFAYEGSADVGIKTYLTEKTAGSTFDEVWLIVGSEGGFSEAEARDLDAKGFRAVTLGDQVLRVETACISLVSILKYELGLMERAR